MTIFRAYGALTAGAELLLKVPDAAKPTVMPTAATPATMATITPVANPPATTAPGGEHFEPTESTVTT